MYDEENVIVHTAHKQFQKYVTASPKLDKNSYLNTRREALEGITWFNLSISLLIAVICSLPCNKVQCLNTLNLMILNWLTFNLFVAINVPVVFIDL